MIPWQAKIAAKIVLSRVPLGYRLWKKLRLFEHGRMNEPAYAEGVFLRHFSRTGLGRRPGFTCLELGPGDSLFSALVAKAHGARLCWLVDTGDFAVRDIAAYHAMARHLAASGLASPAMEEIRSLDDLLARCDARYVTDGVASLRQIPTGSVDFLWSQAVLEHVRLRDFDAMLAETRRILRPDGFCSHRIDLQDHLGGALNNLRFSERLWESDWFARSGFYTNRLRFGELLRRCRRAGFTVEMPEVERWPRLPTPRERLAAPFRDLPEEELRVCGCDLVLRPA